MENKTCKIIVTENFEKQAEVQYDYIYTNSPQNADKFADGLSPAIKLIYEHPKAYPPEPIIPTKQNLYRFKLYMKSWKIVFKVTNNLLIILGIVNTKRHPREIKKLRTSNYK